MKPTPIDLEDGYYSPAELNLVRQARQLKKERDDARAEVERLRAYGAAIVKGFCLDDAEPAAAPSAAPGVEER